MAGFDHVTYVSDNGTTYQRKTLADLVTPLGLTTDALGAHTALPSNIHARYILAIDAATGREHKLVGLGAANAHWTGATVTIVVPDPADRTSATLTLNIAGRIGEKRFAR